MSLRADKPMASRKRKNLKSLKLRIREPAHGNIAPPFHLPAKLEEERGEECLIAR